MQVVDIKEANNNFKSIFDSVYYDNEEVIIHKSKNENVVVIPLEEYNSIKETNYLLSSKNNRERLYESIKELDSGKVIEIDIDELKD